MEKGLPSNIINFLSEFIETVSQLELLLLIYENKSIEWTADSVSKALRTHPSMAAKQMDILFYKGILNKRLDTSYTYGPETQMLDETIVQLYSLYHVRPVAIVTFIYTKPDEKLKGFADAFKFIKD